MKDISNDILDHFCQVWLDESVLDIFEKWIYESKEVKENLNSDAYYEFLSFNYKKKGAHSDLKKLMENHVTKNKIESWKILEHCNNVRNRTDNVSESIRAFYNLQCSGYDFMDELAYSYGLTLECPINYSQNKSFDQLDTDQKQSLIDQCYPEILFHIDRLENWILNEKIILLGRDSEFSILKYVDNRNQLEKSRRIKTGVAQENSSGKWWKFWV